MATAAPLRIAILRSSWHSDLVDICVNSCRKELGVLGVDKKTIDVITAPGALEFPLLAQKLAQTGKYQGIVACALVVDGGIYRHEFVAKTVIEGLVRVGLDTGVPVFSASLTPHHFHEHEVHHEFFSKHLAKKGAEAAHACVNFTKTLATIK